MMLLLRDPLRELTVYLLVIVVLSSTTIWLATGIATLCWRRASAAMRHRLWGLSMLAVLVAPLLIALLPIQRWTFWTQVSTHSVVTLSEQNAKFFEASSVADNPSSGEYSRIIRPDADHLIAADQLPSVYPRPPIASESLVVESTPQRIGLNAKSEPQTEGSEFFSLTGVLNVVIMIWVFGTFISLWNFATSVGKVSSWLRHGFRLESGREIDRCNAIRQQFAIKAPVRLVTHSETNVPFITGILHSTLVLPTGYGHWSIERLNVVLTHELMHVRRADLFWQTIGRVCVIPLWFHPLGWIANWRLHVECEHACDNAVLESGETPCDYASHLVEIAEWVKNRSHSIPHAVAMASRSPVEQRIRSILDPSVARSPAGRWRTWCSVVGLSMIVLAITVISPSRSESQPPIAEMPSSQIAQAEPKKEEATPDTSTELSRNARLSARIKAALEANTTIDIPAGTQFVEVLKTLTRLHQVPIGFDEKSFHRSRIYFDEMKSAASFKDAPLKSVIASVMIFALEKNIDPGLLRRDGAFQIGERNGVLMVTAFQGEMNPPLNEEQRKTITTLSGTVRDVDGKPVTSAVVEVTIGRETKFVSADNSGEFQVEVDAYFPDISEYFVFASDESNANMASWTVPENIKTPLSSTRISLVVKPVNRIKVLVVDSNNLPVSNAKTGLLFAADAKIGSRFLRPRSVFRWTDESGTAEFVLPANVTIQQIFAAASGKGLDYKSYVDRSPEYYPEGKQPLQPEGVVKLTLEGSKTVTLRVRDEESRPVDGLSIHPWYFQKYDEGPLYQGHFLLGDYRFGTATTNSNGIAVFDWFPKWQSGLGMIQFSHDSQNYERQRIIYDPKKSNNDEVDVLVRKHVIISGKVYNSNGRPLAGAKVSAAGDGFTYDRCHTEAVTDDNGNYSLKVSPHQIYLIVAASKDGTQINSRDGILAYPGQPISDADLKLQPATRVFGRVTIGTDNAPWKNFQISFYQYGKDLHQFKDANFPNPDNSNNWVQPKSVSWLKTNDEGLFELKLGPGNYDIRGPQNQIHKFTINDQSELEFSYHSERPDKGSFSGTVVTGNPPRPVANAVYSITDHSTFGDEVFGTTDELGQFHVIRGLFPSAFYARSSDSRLAALIEIGPDDSDATIQLEATATYTARILDHNQRPLPEGSTIQYGVQIDMGTPECKQQRMMHGGNVFTGTDGRVTLANMVVGAEYHVWLENKGGQSWSGITRITPEKSGQFERGDLTVKQAPPPYKPPTLEERIEKAFERPLSPIKRFQGALEEIKLTHQYNLVTFANPKHPLTNILYRAYFENEEIGNALNNFRTIAIPIGEEKNWTAAKELIALIGVKPQGDGAPTLAITDENGKLLDQMFVLDNLDIFDAQFDQAKLLRILKKNAPKPLDATALVADAMEQARRENKRVFIQQTATWCGPCMSLTKFLNKHRDIWEKDYIWVKIDERWLHADEVMKPIRKEAKGGIPWFAILDSEGKTLATSNTPDGDNIGFPSNSEPTEIKHFLAMLKATALRLTEDDLAKLKAALEMK